MRERSGPHDSRRYAASLMLSGYPGVPAAAPLIPRTLLRKVMAFGLLVRVQLRSFCSWLCRAPDHICAGTAMLCALPCLSTVCSCPRQNLSSSPRGEVAAKLTEWSPFPTPPGAKPSGRAGGVDTPTEYVGVFCVCKYIREYVCLLSLITLFGECRKRPARVGCVSIRGAGLYRRRVLLCPYGIPSGSPRI